MAYTSTVDEEAMQRLLAKVLPGMNITAVSLLLEGNEKEAIDLFYQCIDISKSLHDAKFFDVRNSFFKAPDDYGCIVSCVPLGEGLSAEKSSSSSAGRNNYKDNCFHLFNNAFVLDIEEIACHTSLMTLVATLHYNIAVVYHELGQQLGNMEWLSSALRFYQVTQQIVTEHGLETLVSKLDLALCNNLGHLFSVFCNREGMVESRCRLSRQLHLAPFTSQVSDPDFYDFFRISLFLARNVETLVAPAA